MANPIPVNTNAAIRNTTTSKIPLIQYNNNLVIIGKFSSFRGQAVAYVVGRKIYSQDTHPITPIKNNVTAMAMDHKVPHNV
jgi:hypothetical protein